MPSSSSGNDEGFNNFYKNWLDYQQILLNQLLDNENHENNNNSNSAELINKVLCHYTDYYEHKTKIIWHDIFILFSPPWLTPFEKPFLWLTGFKPSLAFSIIQGSITDINQEQSQRLKQLKAETKRQERDLMDEFATVQESMGAPPMLCVMREANNSRPRRVNGVVDDDEDEFDEGAMQSVKNSMSWVVQSADNLRRNTVLKMVEILNLRQNLKFLGAVVKYQFQIRAGGVQQYA